jgi:site-specific DNA-methyltransferase (adenine-specific)
MIECKDSLEFLKERQDYENDIIFADPPYALGSEIMIRPDGKVDYKKAADFMGKWDMPTGDWWEQWFKEAFRSLKHGGYCILYGVDRQLLLFKYYAALAGFIEQQSLYWAFLSNFPKSVDLSKMLDKHYGCEREVIGKCFDGKGSDSGSGIYAMNNGESNLGKEYDITAPSHELAKKYDGYKYSISPLKQTNETVMVFQKPYKSGSCLHDTLAYENGDNTCCCGALNIDGNRVATDEELGRQQDKSPLPPEKGFNNNSIGGKFQAGNPAGRFPAQTLVDSKMAKALDNQTDSADGASKLLHICDFESDELELYYYEPKVSKNERDAGLEELDPTNANRNKAALTAVENREASSKNPHPTLKPLSLNFRILSLFKTPNPQRICFPFAGSGSEVIGGIKAGFTDWTACELSQEYVDIAMKRIEYYSKGAPERKVIKAVDADGNEKKVIVEQLDMFE